MGFAVIGAHFRAIERAKAAEREGDEETEEPGNDDEGEAAAESAPTDVDTAANGAEEATAATAAASQGVLRIFKERETTL